MRIALFSGNYNYIREGAKPALNILVRYVEQELATWWRVIRRSRQPAFEPGGTLVPVPSVPLRAGAKFRLALAARAIRADLKHLRPTSSTSRPPTFGDGVQTMPRPGIPVVASRTRGSETYLDYYGLGGRAARRGASSTVSTAGDHVLAPTPALVAARCAPSRRRGSVGRGVDREPVRPVPAQPGVRAAKGWSDENTVICSSSGWSAKGRRWFLSIVSALQRRNPASPADRRRRSGGQRASRRSPARC